MVDHQHYFPTKKALALVLGLSILVLLGLGGSMYYERALAPITSQLKPVIFTIQKGSTLNHVTQELKEKGLIRSRLAFMLLAHLKGVDRSIKAGKYVLSPSYPAEKILDILVKGQGIRFVITIPEGKNIYDVGKILEEAGLFKRKEFLKAATDKSLLKSLGVPGDSAEGYLFPDTYYVSYGMGPEDVVKMCVMHFWDIWHTKHLDQKAKARGLDVHTVVILASIVEREALVERERNIIASVFFNRLKRGMKLQADPTVRYGLLVDMGIFPRRLRTRHLRHKSPYNTYVYKGLPKGPVCNPGLDSLKAVLDPADTDYLYFVSMNNGTHKFSKTLKEHNRAVYEYQIRKVRPQPRKETTQK